MNANLLPCAHCGGPARVDADQGVPQKSRAKLTHVWWTAACMATDCCVQTRRWPTRDDAVLAWNRRGGAPCAADTRLIEERGA